MDNPGPHFAIGALSRRVDCPIETIRYYERIGLLPRPARTAGGYRMYGEGAVRRLAFVLRTRALGFSLPEARALLGLAEGRKPSCAAVRDLAAAHLAETRRKIDDLRRLERVLTGMVKGCAEGRVPDCPLIEALYRSPPPTAGKRGAKNDSPPTRGGGMRKRT